MDNNLMGHCLGCGAPTYAQSRCDVCSNDVDDKNVGDEFMEIGTRVGAYMSIKKHKVMFLGYGTYQGEKIPIEATGYFAELAVKNETKSPAILLDSGDTVYGCEVYFGEEKRVKELVKKLKIVNVTVSDYRQDKKNDDTDIQA